MSTEIKKFQSAKNLKIKKLKSLKKKEKKKQLRLDREGVALTVYWN